MPTKRIITSIVSAFLLLPLASMAAPLAVEFQKIETYMAASKFDDVILLTRKLEKLYPARKAELLAERATAYMYKGNIKEARKNAEESLLIDQKNHEAHWVLANVFMSLGLSDKGMKEHELSIKNPTKKSCKPCASKNNTKGGNDLLGNERIQIDSLR